MKFILKIGPMMLDKSSKRKVYSLDDIKSAKSYLTRIGAEIVGMRRARIIEKLGRYDVTKVEINFNISGKVHCSDAKYQPDENEFDEIQEEMSSVSWPTTQPLNTIKGTNVPPELTYADPNNIFTFHDKNGKVCMLQLRINNDDGTKKYISYTFWSDGKWRAMEPDAGLPIWGAERLHDAEVVFLHEGAKAAKAVHEMLTMQTPDQIEKRSKHPWTDKLKGTHVGWIGGAPNPMRTNWNIFKEFPNIKKIFVVLDNDKPGRAALPHISKQLNVETYAVQFTEQWPNGFDLADEFPFENLYTTYRGKIRYIGPDFDSCVIAATWATDYVEKTKETPAYYKLREHFKSQWIYISKPNLYFYAKDPRINFMEEGLKKHLAPFCHPKADVVSLINQSFQGTHMMLCYTPSDNFIRTTYDENPAINLHVPSRIKPVAGDAGPWLEYLEYMFPIVSERLKIEKWIATLLARPAIRMGYGLLIISETQGIGKSTLGEVILRPLLGHHNVSTPSSTDLTETAFNSWLPRKRLVFVNEIYEGRSWKGYNRLKSAITDFKIEINEKYATPYTIDNWAHFIACSNSIEALKIENTDRRWFIPKVNEIPWPDSNFTELRDWLTAGGLEIIKWWAINYGDYVKAEEKAPMTERKQEMIINSRSEVVQTIYDFVAMMNACEKPVAMGMKHIATWAKGQSKEKCFDTNSELRKAILNAGAILFMELKIDGIVQDCCYNVALRNVLEIDEFKDFDIERKFVRQFLMTPDKFKASFNLDEM